MLPRPFLALGVVLFLLTGTVPAVLAAPDRNPSAGVAASGQVAFPAAAGIKPGTRPVGPTLVPPEPDGIGTALFPNDIVVYDGGYTGSQGALSTTGGAILNLSVRNGGTGTESILASSTAGSGTPYFDSSDRPGEDELAVSPAGLVYYVNTRVVGSTNYEDVVELNPVTGVRRVISSGSDTTLGQVVNDIYSLCYDYATASLLVTVTATTNGGIYRVNLTTGVRTLVIANSTTANGVEVRAPQYLTTDPFGNIFYLDSSSTQPGFVFIVEIPVTADSSSIYGSRRYISSNTLGAQNSAPYNQLKHLQIDNTQAVTLSGGLPTNEYLISSDEGDDQTSSDIYRIPVATGDHVRIINSATNTGSAVFDLPGSVQADSTGRLYYPEYHNFTNGNTNNVNTGNVIPAGTRADTILSSVQNLANSNNTATFRIVPPPTPTLAAGTTSNVAGTTVTLNSNVTADGGVVNAGIFQRGFVYAQTAVNSNPRIGGTGATQVSTLSLTTLPAAQGQNLGAFSSGITGLTSGVSYTFTAYARDFSGITYSAPVTFATATAPAVSTTSPAMAITGVSATLGGNVTSDGGGAITARGIVYSSTATAPTIGMSGVINVTDASATTGVFTDGTGNNLANGTLYYFRAYATNAVGTTYGSVLSFRTIAAPTANSQSVNVPFNTATAITLTGSDPNTPAQTLTYTVTAAPTHGTLSGTAPNLTYTPTTGYNGADSFQFTTTNTSGLTSAAATVSLTVAAGTPTANGQNVNVPFNTATAITLTGSDPNVPAQSLTYAVTSQTSHGTLSGTAPNLTYTPQTNYQGADIFQFTVTNARGLTSSPATVTIIVAAGTPTANSQSVNVPFNTATALTLTGSDPDQPPLTLTYTVLTTPAHGTLSGTAPNLTYTPTANYQGADSFTFRTSNGRNNSSVATVSLTVAAGTPTANAQSVNAYLNVAKAITLTGTDPDGPALPLTYTVTTAPVNGTLSGTAPNLTYTPTTGYTGTDSFTFRVSNGQNTSTTATVSITVFGVPVVSGFTASGSTGSTVSLTGSQFTGATGITFFRNVAATSFTVVSDTQIIVTVPNGATTGTLRVTTPAGTATTTTKFTVTPPTN